MANIGRVARAAPDPQSLPSLKTLGIASAISLAVAAVVLVIAVLPAEYGIDPLGVGRALGLTALSQPAGLAPLPPHEGEALTPVQQGVVGLYAAEYNVDSRELILGPYEYIEYKYRLAQGATMLFSWSADGNLIHDFHGDPEGEAASAAQSYDSQPRREGHGSFAAPFSGIHGWFWENPGGQPITIRLRTAGFYREAHEFGFDGSRTQRTVQGPEIIPFADSKAEGAR